MGGLMRFVRLTDKIKNKRLAQPIVNNKGQILVAKNQKLTEQRINLLLNQGIRSVYISSEIKSSLTDIIPQEDRKEEIKEFKEFADGILE
jgi:molybdopterin biosynthesis enzyme